MRSTFADITHQDGVSKNYKSSFAQDDRVFELTESFNEVHERQLMQLIVDSIPEPAAMLTADWKIFSANSAINNFKTLNFQENHPGGRPGDVLACIHAIDTPGGCGNSEYCRFCGIFNAILECQRTGMQIQKECRLTSRNGRETVSHDFLITIAPCKYYDDIFYVFTARDISDRKRRIILEKMLFNPVLNTVSDLNDILHEINGTKVNSGIKESGEFAENAANNLMNDIMMHRTLAAAEKDEYRPVTVGYDVNLIMQEVANFLKHQRIAEGKSIVVKPFKDSSEPFADVQLLRWILINLVRNGLEASFRSDSVTMRAIESAGCIHYKISNPGIIPEGVRHQIFQRSFSTKGNDRGLGSYIVKLFTNKYLQGQVYFESDVQSGTVFTVIIPLRPEILI